MVEIVGGDRPSESDGHARGRRRAAGIYGAIVTAAILAAVGNSWNTLGLVIAVLITLVVYWLAEEYAALLGEQVEGGVMPTWPYVRSALVATWPQALHTQRRVVGTSKPSSLATVLTSGLFAPASSPPLPKGATSV